MLYGYKYRFNKSGSITGSVDVSTSPTKACVGQDNLENRHTLIVENDASLFLYWSYNNNFTIGVDSSPIPSGVGKIFHLDPNEERDIYLLTSELSSNVKVTEIK